MDIHDFPYRHGVLGYILNKETKLLLFQHPTYAIDEWRLPGGGVHEDEDETIALKREILQEFRIHIEILAHSPIVHQYDWPIPVIEANMAQQRYFQGQRQSQYLARYSGGIELDIDRDEVRDYNWVYPRDVIPLLHENFRPTAVKTLHEFNLL
jgi:8-oxo-dGTP pyrophosphatase MutT (NUDIX family)